MSESKYPIETVIEYHLQSLQEELGEYISLGLIDYYETFKALQGIDLARELEPYLEGLWLEKLEKEA